jgi:hypothetical protein
MSPEHVSAIAQCTVQLKRFCSNAHHNCRNKCNITTQINNNMHAFIISWCSSWFSVQMQHYFTTLKCKQPKKRFFCRNAAQLFLSLPQLERKRDHLAFKWSTQASIAPVILGINIPSRHLELSMQLLQNYATQDHAATSSQPPGTPRSGTASRRT